ncbi:YceI family protein [Alteromonas ponticola]|uniref:YceI family protein n=1 Tax=Alteromonas aquimaris TaxID=2998417 RepID=A0ABT3P8M1_9ALTE|nr:YceI family protein [Alteromonas aquimaris]MCW8109119.1 YceI family protein [Alteromonas aquimaris]
MKKLALALAFTLGASVANAADYIIDTKGAHASINFKIQHLGYSWLTGRFNDFSGEFSYEEGEPKVSKVNVTVKTASIDSNHAERDKHLRGDDFLDVKKYPEATFVSTNVTHDGDDEMTIIGDLTLHGVTRSVSIDAHKVGEGKDPWGGYRAGFAGETHIALKDFGIDYDLGPASTEVKLMLHIEGVKQ